MPAPPWRRPLPHNNSLSVPKLARTGKKWPVALSVQDDDVNVLLHFWAELPLSA